MRVLIEESKFYLTLCLTYVFKFTLHYLFLLKARLRHFNETRAIALERAGTLPTRPTPSICCARKSINFTACER